MPKILTGSGLCDGQLMSDSAAQILQIYKQDQFGSNMLVPSRKKTLCAHNVAEPRPTAATSDVGVRRSARQCMSLVKHDVVGKRTKSL